jgi:hypothetical protein
MDPTDRMIRIYHHLVDHMGEATNIIEFDETAAGGSSHLPFVHVAIWDAKSDDDLTILHTLGMSEKYMNSADYLAELCWHIRGKISEDDKHNCSRFMANLTEYPFVYDLKLDWWGHLVDPGKMPMFPGCKTLLLAPALSEIALEPFPSPGSEVKTLHIYPITDLETHVVAEHGREEFSKFIEERRIDLFSDRPD